MTHTITQTPTPGQLERLNRSPVGVVVESLTQAVTLAEARAQVDLDPADTSMDDELARIIRQATDKLEYDTGLRLVPAELKQYFGAFPGVGLPGGFLGPDIWIQLGMRPLISICEFQYLDSDDNFQKLFSGDDYVVDTNRKPGALRPPGNGQWPQDAANTVDSIWVSYIGGMGDRFTVDADADTITTGYRYGDGQAIQLVGLTGALPDPLAEATSYYVLGSGTTFQLSLTAGGAPIDLTTVGTDQQFILRLWPRAQDALLVLIRQMYDMQAGVDSDQAQKAYDRLANRMYPPRYP